MIKRSLLALARLNLTWAAGLLAAAVACCWGARAEPAGGPWYALPTISFIEPGPAPNGVFVFVGPLSTTGVASTASFNLAHFGSRSNGPLWDNSVAGAAYDRDFFGLGGGWIVGGEVGFADRYGTYAMCCDRIIASDGILNSFEVWGGAQLRYSGILLFDTIRIGGAVTVGLSGVGDSIGREFDRKATTGSDPTLLYFFAPEFDFSTPSLPNVEFVVRLQHRSGCKAYGFLPVLGNMREGYNADVFGFRYRF